MASKSRRTYRYVATTPPSGSAQTEPVKGLLSWILREFRKLQVAFGRVHDHDILIVEPTKPKDGMVRFAIGTPGWDPGGGKGPYWYDEDTTDWIKMAGVTGGGTGPATFALDDLSDVSAGSPSTGHFLKWDGSAWVNAGITESDITDLDHTDVDAIHDNVAGEIQAITEKASPVSADLVLIEDSAAGYNKKRVQIGNLPGGGGSSAFTGLTDTPGSYSGFANYFVRVNAGETALEFTASTSSYVEDWKTGWEQDYGANVTLSFNPTTREFSIAPTGASFTYYIEGSQYVKSSAQTVTITDTEGLWFIYFVGGTLTASQTPWSITDNDRALVAVLYWDATNNEAITLGYELHSWVMDPSTHHYLHHTFGTRWESGLAVEIVNSNTQLDVAAGVIHDEDIHIGITDSAAGGLWEQDLTPAQLPILYRDGASGDWRKIAASTTPVYLDTNVLQYNEWTGATWQLSDVTLNRYCAYWVIATNDISEPVIIVPGQEDAATLPLAREGNSVFDMNFAGLPSAEHKVIARVLVRRTGSSPFYNLVEVADYRDTSDEPSGAGSGSATDFAAIHDNVANEIAVIAAKGTPVDADVLLIEDSAASYGKKSITIGDISSDGIDSSAIHDDTAGEINALTEKASPVSADLIIIEDSEASNAKKKVQIGNLPSGGGGGENVLLVTADQDVTNNNTPAFATNMSFTAEANKTYLLEMFVKRAADSTCDYKYTIDGPSGSTGFFIYNFANSEGIANTFAFSLGTTRANGGSGLSTPYLTTLRALVHVGATGGTVGYKFSQNTLHATQIARLMTDSWLSYREIA